MLEEMRIDLCALPFSGRNASLAIREDGETRALYLYLVRSTQPIIERDALIRITPVIDNKDDMQWTYTADAEKLVLSGIKGSIEFCFQRGNLLRIRGRGESLRWYCDDLKIYENAAPREDGSLELAYEILGKLLVVPIKGGMHHTAMWNHEKVKTNAFLVEFVPDTMTGEFDVAVHEYYANGVRDESYPPFDDCLAAAKRDFDAFLPKAVSGREAHAMLEKKAAHVLRVLHMPAEGLLKAPSLFSSKNDRAIAIGWQQALAAIALPGDPQRAYDYLMASFAAQAEDGQIPNGASCAWLDYLSCGLPIQGYALERLWAQNVVFTQAQAKSLYEALSRYATWLRENRVRDGLPLYYHPQESGFMDTTVFLWGGPVASPDLAAWLALLYQAVGKLAVQAGHAHMQASWDQAAKETINAMLSELWRDDHFVCRNMRTGRTFRANSVQRLLPIMLGKQLPIPVADALAAEIEDSSTYLTTGGVAGEKLGSKEFSLAKGSLLRGGIVPMVQLVLATGLIDIDKRDLAETIVERTLCLMESVGLGDSIPPFRNDPWTGKALWPQDAWRAEEIRRRTNPLRNEIREPRDLLHWTAAGAAGALALAKLL